MIICGDTNIDVLKNNALIKNYLNIITANGFNCFADEPTRETENTSTCLDHFIFQNINLTRSFVLKEENISDHYPVLIEWDSCQLEKPEISFRDASFLKNKSLHDEFLQRLDKSLSACKEKFFTEEGPGSAFNKFKNIFENTLNLFAPIKSFNKPACKTPKWFTDTLKNLRAKRNCLPEMKTKSAQQRIPKKKFRKLRDNFELAVKKI